MKKLELYEWLLKSKAISLESLISTIAMHSEYDAEYVKGWVIRRIFETPECVYCDLESDAAIKYFSDNGGKTTTYWLDDPFESIPEEKRRTVLTAEQDNNLRLIQAELGEDSPCRIDFNLFPDGAKKYIKEILKEVIDIDDNDLGQQKESTQKTSSTDAKKEIYSVPVNNLFS